jgi:capsular polysaccharide transport system permease protein
MTSNKLAIGAEAVEHRRPQKRSSAIATQGRPVKNYVQVIYALVLHDIKSRYFGNGLGQILLLVWPLTHLLFLVLAYTVSGRLPPFGSSLLLFACTGAVPWIVFSYMSRWIVFAPLSNRPLLFYPVVTPLDLIVGRALLEIVNSILIVVLVIALLVMADIDPWPHDLNQAAEALGVCFVLALALGIINAAIVLVSNLWATVYILAQIVLYIASGLVFLPSSLPEFARYPLSFNPVLQIIEWMRFAYYADYPTIVLDRLYVTEFSFMTLVFGLIFERVMRRWVFLL